MFGERGSPPTEVWLRGLVPHWVWLRGWASPMGLVGSAKAVQPSVGGQPRWPKGRHCLRCLGSRLLRRAAPEALRAPWRAGGARLPQELGCGVWSKGPPHSGYDGPIHPCVARAGTALPNFRVRCSPTRPVRPSPGLLSAWVVGAARVVALSLGSRAGGDRPRGKANSPSEPRRRGERVSDAGSRIHPPRAPAPSETSPYLGLACAARG